MRAPDSGLETTHVRCGTDIAPSLAAAGFEGSFIEFSDPVCQGPVPRERLLEARARFLTDSYGADEGRVHDRLKREAEQLARTIGCPRVVLWFEHDSYDQLVLARILSFYQREGIPEYLELICADSFPGIDRFIGLGQLTPDNLRALWNVRRPVSGALLQLGRRVWDALREPTPVGLHALSSDTTELTVMGLALRRHLQELPWSTDGLSLTQRLTLELLMDGPATDEELFKRLTAEREPLPFLGDTMYSAILRDLLAARIPPIRVMEEGQRPGRIALTEAGHRTLGGELSFLSCDPRERWVGGVRILAGRPVWCWDPKASRPTLWNADVDQRD